MRVLLKTGQLLLSRAWPALCSGQNVSEKWQLKCTFFIIVDFPLDFVDSQVQCFFIVDIYTVYVFFFVPQQHTFKLGFSSLMMHIKSTDNINIDIGRVPFSRSSHFVKFFFAWSQSWRNFFVLNTSLPVTTFFGFSIVDDTSVWIGMDQIIIATKNRVTFVKANQCQPCYNLHAKIFINISFLGWGKKRDGLCGYLFRIEKKV